MTKNEALQILAAYVSRSINNKLRAQLGYFSEFSVAQDEINELLGALDVLEPMAKSKPQVLQWDSTLGGRPNAPDGCAWLHISRGEEDWRCTREMRFWLDTQRPLECCGLTVSPARRRGGASGIGCCPHWNKEQKNDD